MRIDDPSPRAQSNSKIALLVDAIQILSKGLKAKGKQKSNFQHVLEHLRKIFCSIPDNVTILDFRFYFYDKKVQNQQQK